MSESATRTSLFTQARENLENAQRLMILSQEQMKLEAEAIHQEREEFEEIRKKLGHVHFDTAVKLNVGGKLYKTSLETLLKDPNSMLATMFSGRFDVKSAEDDGAYFIDRDGKLFRHVLNFLRDGKLHGFQEIPLSTKQQLLEEARFYQIQSLIDELSPPLIVFQLSTILAGEDERAVLSWLPDVPSDSEWTLLYKASRDGWEPRDFHERCDRKHLTLTFVKSDCNVFGGYTERSWESKADSDPFTETASISTTIKHVLSPRSFLFTLVNRAGRTPERVFPKVEDSVYGIRGGLRCSSSQGPSFGSKDFADLLLLGFSSNRRMGYFYLGRGYQRPTDRNISYFTGLENFFVDDIEVFTPTI